MAHDFPRSGTGRRHSRHGATPSSSSAAALGDKPALIDGPSGRTLTYADGPRRYAGRRPGCRHAASARATSWPSSAPTSPSTRSPSTPSRSSAASSPPSIRCTRRTSCSTSSRTPARATSSPCRRSSTRRGGRHARRASRCSSSARRRARRRFAALLAADDAPPGRRRSIRAQRRRRPPLLERHHRPAQGRDAHATATSWPTSCSPTSVLGVRRGRRRPRRAAVLPHLRHGRDHEPRRSTGATVVTMPRFDLEQCLQALQKYRVTFANVVPPIVLALAKNPLVDKYDLSACARSSPAPRRSASARRGRGTSASAAGSCRATA